MAFLQRKNGIQFLMTTFMLKSQTSFSIIQNIPTRRGKKVDLNHSLRFDTIWVKMQCLNSKVQTSYGLHLSWSIKFHNRVSFTKEAFLFFVDRTILANLDLCYCSFNLCFKKVMMKSLFSEEENASHLPNVLHEITKIQNFDIWISNPTKNMTIHKSINSVALRLLQRSQGIMTVYAMWLGIKHELY